MAYYTVTWQNLMDFLEANQNEWDSRNVEKNILGLEPEWLIEKRKRDVEENPLWYRKWTQEEIKIAESLFKMGKSYKEIASIIERSDQVVADFLRNLGYSYMLPQYWKDEELEYLKENYQNMTYQEIAEELGRTSKAVNAKAEKIGFQKKLVKTEKKSQEN